MGDGGAVGAWAAGCVVSRGKGCAALGGVGVSEPVPGAAVPRAISTGMTTGIRIYCPWRTSRSGPRPFHSASALTDTL